jgi:hypothetical protein
LLFQHVAFESWSDNNGLSKNRRLRGIVSYAKQYLRSLFCATSVLVAFARLFVALAVVGDAGDVAGVAVDVVVDALEAAVGQLDEVGALGAVAVAGLAVAELGFGCSAVAAAVIAVAVPLVARGTCSPGELVVGLI